MYVNAGDRDFFQYGRLADSEHSDTEIKILACDPFCDEENLFLFGDCDVDITDEWIDKKAVMDYIGMTEDTFDPVGFAVGCVDYYGVENWDTYNGSHGMTRKEIEDILKYRLIASDNLDITW